MAGWWLVTACLAFAALSLLAPSTQLRPVRVDRLGSRADPGAGGETFSLAGGPSSKPLPVLFTRRSRSPGGRPGLWLLVTRAGLLLALAGAFALGSASAAVGRRRRRRGVLLMADFLSLAWRGASEPLLLACVLWAVERHLAGRARDGVLARRRGRADTPGSWPFLALYALWRWRQTERASARR